MMDRTFSSSIINEKEVEGFLYFRRMTRQACKPILCR